MTTIYKKDSKGKLRSLSVWTDEDVLYQESGLIDGKKVVTSKVCTPKNVGKSNETTGVTQAEAQASALVVKKLKEAYHNTLDDAKECNLILPMLAKDYFKRKHKVSKNIAIQPKLDGIRCMVFYDYVTNTAKAVSRKNIPIKNVDHILEEVVKYASSWNKDFIFDGELYLHGKTFQEVTKLVNNKPEEVLVEYHIYDMIVRNTNFTDRCNSIISVFGWYSNLVHIVPTVLSVAAPLEDFYKGFIDEGYEGMMVRNKDSMYKISGRSDDLLKYKKFIDVALPIEDITPNTSKPNHGTVWVKFNGNLQKTGAKLSHSDREELLLNKDYYIGQMAEIRYFEETDEGLMRFPVYHGIRIDK